MCAHFAPHRDGVGGYVFRATRATQQNTCAARALQHTNRLRHCVRPQLDERRRTDRPFCSPANKRAGAHDEHCFRHSTSARALARSRQWSRDRAECANACNVHTVTSRAHLAAARPEYSAQCLYPPSSSPGTPRCVSSVLVCLCEHDSDDSELKFKSRF